jgi:undecaprenyl diphosphate synthase
MSHGSQENENGVESAPPRHVAIIMDGNGRWASHRGLSRRKGHAEGAESVRAITRECARIGLDQLTLYAFSAENWKRPRAEVAFLMELLRRFLVSERNEIMDNNIRFCAIGRVDALPGRVQKALAETIRLSEDNTGMILRLALNYGGRQELLDAAKGIARAARENPNLDIDALTEDDFHTHLYAPEMGDPDLLIRTGGEMRLSNFLLWQLSYAELYFAPVYWPDFRENELHEAFAAYAGRQRRFGGLPERSPEPLASTTSNGAS